MISLEGSQVSPPHPSDEVGMKVKTLAAGDRGHVFSIF
jgi:hypothetical protein